MSDGVRDLRQPAGVHHADAVGERHRLLLIVRDDDEGQTELVLQVHQLEAGIFAELAVERRQRLVEQQHPRPLGKRARERDALALAAGKLVRALRAPKPSSLTSASISRDPRLDLGLRHSVLLEPEGDVALDRQVREQRIALEHHVDRPPVRRHAGDILPVQQDAALARLLEAREHPQQRGLAAARGPEQREEFAFEDVQRQPLDGDEIAEALAHRLEPHQRLGGQLPTEISAPPCLTR